MDQIYDYLIAAALVLGGIFGLVGSFGLIAPTQSTSVRRSCATCIPSSA